MRAFRTLRIVVGTFAAAALAGCGGGTGANPVQPTAVTTVTLSYEGATALRTDLPASVQACVQGATPTHTHPSWRGFGFVALQAVGANRWQVVFTDVPVGVTVSLRVNDANACDENNTGAVTRNLFINDVRLTTTVMTPGSGQEPGFSFVVTAGGQIQP